MGGGAGAGMYSIRDGETERQSDYRSATNKDVKDKVVKVEENKIKIFVSRHRNKRKKHAEKSDEEEN